METASGSDWTPEDVERLTTMWNVAGMTAKAISEVMGRSRNAIIGKVRRLGLKYRKSDGAYVDKRYEGLTPRKSRANGLRRVRTTPRPPVMPVEPIEFTAGVWSPLPGSTPVILEQLSGCKWPVSDPFAPRGSIDLFCNCEPLDGRPYCAEHMARSVGEGTASERVAVKVAASVARQDFRNGERAAEQKWSRAA